MKASSNWLLVYLFVVPLASAAWVTNPGPRNYVAWTILVLTAAALWRWPFELESRPAGVRPGWRDAGLTALIAAPAVVNLAGVWGGEFPTCGDHTVHNGFSLEAFAFWWPLPFFIAVAAIAVIVWAVKRNPRSPLPFIGVLLLAPLSLLTFHHGFTEHYPALLHFLTIPFRAAIPVTSPVDIEQLVNLLSIPAWLLLLRPRIVGRHADLTALAIGALYFWQKDVVYHTTSNYLEPWAMVLFLTGAEHLLRFGREALWRPLLLLSTAVLIKETTTILALPVIVIIFFPWTARRDWPRYILTVAAAAAPPLLYAAQPMGNMWRGGRGIAPLAEVFGQHLHLFKITLTEQFGVALWPVLGLGLASLLYLAFRGGRAGLAVALGGLLPTTLFFFSAAQQRWPGEARTNMVFLIHAALAFGIVLERLPRAAAGATVLLVAALNAVPLAPFLRDAYDTSDTRNSFEHNDAPFFFPIREMLDHTALVRPGQRVDVINNGKWLFPYFYPGLPNEIYPDLAARYRLTFGSYRDYTARCRCTDDTARFAIFVRFRNFGMSLPQPPAMHAETSECLSELERTCSRRQTIVHGGALVGVLGVR